MTNDFLTRDPMQIANAMNAHYTQISLKTQEKIII